MAPASPSRQRRASSITEQTPLLQAAPIPVAEPIDETSSTPSSPTHGAIPENQADEEEDVPLPWVQIMLLCYSRMMDPIGFFSIFPYINKMIEDTGVPKTDVGFYSGLIESLMSVCQTLVMVFWGRAADKYGRKPILVISLCGVTLSTALFGLSKSVWQMIVFRCIAGVFTASILTVRAMISENSTKRTQARAFSYFAFSGNLGIFLAPFIGGAFESPAEKFPSTFGRVTFFRNYPYALPGFVCALFGVSMIVLVTIFVKETLHVHHGKKTSSNGPLMSIGDILKHPGVILVLALQAQVAILAYSYTAVLPLFLYTPVEFGGLGFPPSGISLIMGLGGLSQALWLLIVFPPLQKRIGTGGIFRVCAAAWPPFFAAAPVCNLLIRHGLEAPFWALGSFVTIVGSGVAMSFIAIQLAINDIAPSHETLGTLNSIALALSSFTRAVVPAISTTIYAIGIREQILQGHLIWAIIIIPALFLSVLLIWFPKKAEGKIARRTNGSA